MALASAAKGKAPAKKTSPVVYLGAVAAVVAAYLVLNPASSDTSGVTTGTVKKKKTTKDTSGFTEADYAAQAKPFPPVTKSSLAVFNPLVKKSPIMKLVGVPIKDPQGPKGISSVLTGGDPNWYYTGSDSINGRVEALLENSATGETAYVKAGEAWKNARVVAVDVGIVTLSGRDGTTVDVPKLQYGETIGGGTRVAANPANAPLGVPAGAIQGAIGVGRLGTIGVQPVGGPNTVQLSNGQTLQLPPQIGAPAAPAETVPDTNVRNGRRRRNRNQNFGDPNNGF